METKLELLKKIATILTFSVFLLGQNAEASPVEISPTNDSQVGYITDKTTTIHLKGKMSAADIIKEIEATTSYKFSYNSRDINKIGAKDVNCSGTIENVLKTVFPANEINFVIKGNEIFLKVISTKPQNQSSKTRILKGQVLDAKTQEPVIGAAIIVDGNKKTGVITDVTGHFTVKVKSSSIITVTCLGYKEETINVGNKKSLNILLSEDTERLSDVVITAFGTGQKKESVVGSIQLVRPDALKVPAANLSSAFAGRLAGVVSYQRSGMPGANGSDFFIRGVSTLSGVTSPLIILDGVEISSGDLNNLDPEIIDGFSILKDATATAMYGTRGANGVMIITTKKGIDSDKPIIGVRIENYITAPTKRPKFVDGARYMELFNEATINQQTGDLLFSKDKIEGTRQALNPYVYPNVDWYKEIFKDYSVNQKANFYIRGGTSKITYFMNMTANHETGMLKNRSKDFFSYNNNINLKKYTFQNNIDFHMTKTSTISLHLNTQLVDFKGPANDLNNSSASAQINSIYNSIMANNPVDFPVMFPQEEKWVRWGAYSGGNDQGATNPLAQSTSGYGESFYSMVVANLEFNQKLDFITKGLRYKALVSFKNYSKTTTNRTQGINRYSLDSFKLDDNGDYILDVKPIGTPSKPVLQTKRFTGGDRRFYFQTFLDYNRTFGKHGLSGMILFNMDSFSWNSGGSLYDSLPKRKMGFAGRLTYDFDKKYLVEFNAGYNGSENFAKKHRFGFFPSAAIGWNISNENFWKSIKPIVSRLKLRASYGLVGNDQIGGERFIYMADVSLQGSPSFTTGYGEGNTQSMKGPAYKRTENKKITWEIGRKVNVGFDLELFKSLNITFDAFKEIRSDIFQQKQSIPNYLGTAQSKIFGNLAKVKNYGFDISAEYGKQIGKDTYIQFLGTFTYARNRVLKYDQAPGMRPANSKIGHSINTIYGFVSDRLYIDEADIANSAESTLGNIAIAPGDIKYIDQPNKEGEYDGKITNDDKVAMGYPTVPEIIYGFGPSITWKNLDFSLFFQGAARTSMILSGMQPFGTQYNRNVLKYVSDNHWDPKNQDINAKYPRLTKYDNNHNNKPSDYWLRNGSFLKLKNAEIGYKFKNARVYVNGMNLLTFSKFKLWDPEMGGGAGLKYPTQRTFNVGIQLTFR